MSQNEINHSAEVPETLASLKDELQGLSENISFNDDGFLSNSSIPATAPQPEQEKRKTDQIVPQVEGKQNITNNAVPEVLKQEMIAQEEPTSATVGTEQHKEEKDQEDQNLFENNNAESVPENTQASTEQKQEKAQIKRQADFSQETEPKAQPSAQKTVVVHKVSTDSEKEQKASIQPKNIEAKQEKQPEARRQIKKHPNAPFQKLEEGQESMKKQLLNHQEEASRLESFMRRQLEGATDLITKTKQKLVGVAKQQGDIDQSTSLSKMAASRKRENYSLLVQWDQKRAESLGLHKNLVEELQRNVDINIKSSLENIDIYASFFKQKAKQEEKYASHPIVNTRILTQNNDVSKNIYINCSVLLNSLSDENMERCKKSQNFSQLIKKSVISDLIQEHVKKSNTLKNIININNCYVAQVELLKTREKISSLKSTLQKYNVQTEQKTVELATHFNECMNHIESKTPTDFYQLQLEFLRKSFEQTRIQKKLGVLVIQYLESAMKEESKRSHVLKEALKVYAAGLKEAYGVEMDKEAMEQLGKQEEQRFIPEYYAVEELLDSRTLYYVKEKLEMLNKEITIRELKQFFESFKPVVFDNRLLILKQFQVMHELGRERTEPCSIKITVDKFLHLVYNPTHEQPYGGANESLRIDRQLQISKVGECTVEIRRKQEKKGMMSLIMRESTKQEPGIQARFGKKDSMEEFIEFVKKLV